MAHQFVFLQQASMQLSKTVGARQKPISAAAVTVRKDDAPAAGQAAITNVAGMTPFSGGGGLIQTTSG